MFRADYGWPTVCTAGWWAGIFTLAIVGKRLNSVERQLVRADEIVFFNNEQL